MFAVQPDLADQPDRRKWNARYSGGFAASFAAHPLAAAALAMPLPDGPVLDLASGPSGSVLAAAAAGRRAVAVDASDVALDLLDREAARRQLARLVGEVHADLTSWRPDPASYALVLCTGYWDRDLFAAAARAVLPGGLLGWEAFTASGARPGMPAQWCLRDGEPASLLPAGYLVLRHQDRPDARERMRRRLLARRQAVQPGLGGAGS